jgi:lysophospholipase L1-like esterase
MAVTNLYHATTWTGGPVSAGGAGSTLQDGWVDAEGGRWSITAGNLLQAAANSTYNVSFLLRPTGENQQDQRMVVAIPTGQPVGGQMIVLRYIDASNFYFAWFNTSGSFYIWRVAGGSLSQVGSTVTFTYNSAKAYSVDFTAEGVSPTTLTAVLTNVTDSTTVGTVSTTDSTAAMQTTGRYGLTANGSFAETIGTVQLYNAAAAGFTASPTTVNVSTVGAVITLVGAGTAWTGGTTFTVSGVSGTSKTAQSVTDGTHATITITTGATAGTLTISDGAVTQTIAVVFPALTVAITDANLFWSPYNWYSNGAGAMQANGVKGSSTYILSNTPGAYLKAKFTAPVGNVTIAIDVSALTGAGAASNQYPAVAYSLDEGAFVAVQLTSASTAITIAVATAGVHTLFLYFKQYAPLGGTTVDRWVTPVNQVRITGLTLPAGTTQPLTQAPTLRSKRALGFGDSITEGSNSVSGGTDDPLLSYLRACMAGLDAEFGIVGFAGQGWTYAPSSTGVKKFHTPADDANTTWNKYFAGQSRLVSGLFSPAPDYITVAHGTNDALQAIANATVTAAANDWLTAVRAAAPSARVFVLVPPGRYKKTALTAATLPDATCYLIDLGAEVAGGLVAYGSEAGDGAAGYGAASRRSVDGLHPNAVGHAELGARLTDAIQLLLTPYATAGGVRRLALTGGISG